MRDPAWVITLRSGAGHNRCVKDATPSPAQAEQPLLHEQPHRNVQGGAIRAAVFGVSDGLVTNVSLILGVAGADAEAGVVRLAGLAGLVAGAFSMAAGEYVSMSAQTELLERELDVERRSLQANPAGEQRELARIYRARGVASETADELSREMMKYPQLALETNAREELGVNPRSLGSPVAAAVSSFIAFAIGAVLPLIPWFFTSGTTAVGLSVLLGAIAALIVGALIGVLSGRGPWVSAIRQLAIGALAGGVTYGIGALLGVQVA
jgi:VIT1/CCC1 family predicted Fe2+/Mn2+ transporter